MIKKVVESLGAFFREFVPEQRLEEEKPKAKTVSGVGAARN